MRWGSGGLAGADLVLVDLAEGLLPPELPPVSISKPARLATQKTRNPGRNPGRNWRDRGRPEAVDRVRQARFHRCNGTLPTVRCSAVWGGVRRGGNAEGGGRGGEARTMMPYPAVDR